MLIDRYVMAYRTENTKEREEQRLIGFSELRNRVLDVRKSRRSEEDDEKLGGSGSRSLES